MAKRQGWEALSPATRARYEKAGVSRAQYEAGASLAKARRVTPERESAQKRAKRAAVRADLVPRARDWSRKHSNSERTRFRLPRGLTPEQQAAWARDYLAMARELEKGWAPAGQRQPADPAKVNRWQRRIGKPKLDTVGEFVSLSPKYRPRRR